MRKHLLLIAVFITLFCKAEQNIKIYYEKNDNGYNIYVDNNEFCPMSIKIKFSVENLKIEGGNNKIHIVKPRSKKQLLTVLKVLNKNKSYKFSYNTISNYGNHNSNKYDKNYKYFLPFKQFNKFEIHQGYNGKFSHQNENALDFTMPVNTELTAIREGIVIKVIDKNKKNCNKKKCIKYNNLIMIYHSDGTFAEYAHIKENGSEVNAGDKVLKGQLIGYSGNVGFSTGPHLHLIVFKQKINKRETLKTKFMIGDGTKTEYLIEKNKYERSY